MVLLFMLIVYVNYVMHFQKDVEKIEKNIVNIEQRILKEEKLFEQRDKFKEINVTKGYTHLFYDGLKHSYSEAMGIFQQDIQLSAKRTNCTIVNTQWQDMPKDKGRGYEVLSLRLILSATPENFVKFQQHMRKKPQLFVFNQLNMVKERRKNLLRISITLFAYRSSENEK
ncbi:MAG: Unknown protein [uncultured Sulfurovum sp.]|uniref:Uncharacterized protein n=1 Tax=uncultured Sulfurovum sp. TaxID=269237 RepID=A0A6S6TB23_9BACT|nr:MAG: Unknown protein [uncultured Sulfurovum sp.]